MSLWPPPALLLGLLLSIGYASLFHLWGGRSARDLVIGLLAAGVGFAVGQLIGEFSRIDSLRIGHLHVVEGSIAAWLALAGIWVVQKQTP